MRAATALDDERRAQLEHDAAVYWQRWGCPDGQHTPTGVFDAGCRLARDGLARVVGCAPDDLGDTCPLYLTRADWARDAFRARKRDERGTLGLWLGGAIPSQTWDAIDALDELMAERDAREEARRERVAARKRAGLPSDPADDD